MLIWIRQTDAGSESGSANAGKFVNMEVHSLRSFIYNKEASSSMEKKKNNKSLKTSVGESDSRCRIVLRDPPPPSHFMYLQGSHTYGGIIAQDGDRDVLPHIWPSLYISRGGHHSLAFTSHMQRRAS